MILSLVLSRSSSNDRISQNEAGFTPVCVAPGHDLLLLLQEKKGGRVDHDGGTTPDLEHRFMRSLTAELKIP
jgi:hypothetical protein